MPKLKELRLDSNQVGEAGMAALASAIRGGVLPSYIYLGGNPGSAAPVQSALTQNKLEQLRSGGAAAEADDLSFTELKWSDAEGVALVGALRAAHERGGLQQLKTLNLGTNRMGDETAAALASLLEAGAMPKLKTLGLDENQIGEAGMAALASAVRGGALPSCEKIFLEDNPGSAAPVKEAAAQREGMKVYATLADYADSEEEAGGD